MFGLKSKWQRLPLTIRRGSKALGWAFFFSLIVLAAAYAYVIYHYANASVDVDPRPWAMTPARAIAFLDAVAAGVAAFALLGALTFLMSLRKPEEDTIDERIAYLYSARRVESAAAHTYLKAQVTLLGAAVAEAIMTIDFTEVSADGQFIRISSKVEMDIVNMMKNDTYRQLMPLRIGLNAIPNFNGTLGYVTKVSTCRSSVAGLFEGPRRFLDVPFKFTNQQLEYLREIDLEIPPGGRVRYEYEWDCWGNIADPNFCGANRFAEIMRLILRNSSNSPIEIKGLELDHRKLRPLKEDIVLQPGDSRTLEFLSVPPTEDIAFTTAVAVA